MENYFNLRVSGEYPCALHWEHLQTQGRSSAPTGLMQAGSPWAVLNE